MRRNSSAETERDDAAAGCPSEATVNKLGSWFCWLAFASSVGTGRAAAALSSGMLSLTTACSAVVSPPSHMSSATDPVDRRLALGCLGGGRGGDGPLCNRPALDVDAGFVELMRRILLSRANTRLICCVNASDAVVGGITCGSDSGRASISGSVGAP